jgi:hypothetical protein
MVGERKAGRVFEGIMHVKGRTFGEAPLAPHDWADEQNRKELRGVLHLLDGKLGLPEISRLGETGTAMRIYTYPEGLLERAATLIAQGAVIAGRQGRPRLTHDILAQAVDELAIGEARHRANPFRVKVVHPRSAEAKIEEHVPRRGRGRRPAAAAVEA